MATYTLVPLPRIGITPEPGMLINTYAAGGSSPAATYRDSNGFATNTNPVVADGNGLFPAIYLPLGTSYKFIATHATANGLTPDPISNIGTVIWTQDGIASVPSSSPSVDINATAGELILANAEAYLSDGSGGKQAGLWYNADSTNTYSSTAPPAVGMATATISSGMSGSIRTSGALGGFTSLTAGATYYAGLIGAITTIAPTNARIVGQADSTTSIIVGGDPNTVAGGKTGASTFTAHGVLLGEGANPIAVTAAGTTGQILAATTSADPSFQAAASVGASDVLLHSGSGTNAAAGATNVDTVTVTGLTALDTLEVLVTSESVTMQTAGLVLYSVTDSLTISDLSGGSAIAAAMVNVSKATVRCRQGSTTLLASMMTGNGSANAVISDGRLATVTSWTGSNIFALRQTGVTAGGTFKYAWSIYKKLGQ